MDRSESLEPSAADVAAAQRAEKIAKKKAAKAAKAQLKAKMLLQEEKGLVRKQYAREKEYTSTTYERAAADWQSMMAEITHKDQRKALDALWDDVEQDLDSKNNLIERLTDNINQSVDQFSRLTESHLEFIGHSTSIFKLFVKSMRDMYAHEVELLINQFYREMSDKQTLLFKHKCFFESVMLGSNVTSDNLLTNAHIMNKKTNDELTNTNTEKNDAMVMAISNNMEILYRRMKRTVDSTRKASMTTKRCKQYISLVNREENDTVILDQKRLDIEKTHMLLMQQMEERRVAEMQSMHDLNDIHREKEYFLECFLTLRESYETDMKKDQKNMRSLMDQTYKTISHLSEIERKGGLILSVAAAVRKLQTEKEKVCPWLDSIKTKSPAVDYGNTLDTMSHLSSMDQFWMKVSVTASQNVALAEEKAYLEAENTKLRDLIRRYCNQEAYNRSICSLRISTSPTVVLPIQEASHMYQFNRRTKEK